MKSRNLIALLAGLLAYAIAQADINVGVTFSTTGPAASLGIPEKNTIALLPKAIGGQTIRYIVLDDATDTTAAVQNTRKLLTENKVDIVIGSSTTPNSLAMIDLVAEGKTPMISVASSARIVDPVDAKKRWVFKTPQSDTMMSTAIAQHMAASGIKTVAFIAFNDSFGDAWFDVFGAAAKANKLQIVANERFARTDTSVVGQTLKLMSVHADAVFIAGAGTPAALPQKSLRERGYVGKIYQTHGVANADFLRVGGRDVEGTILPAGPVLVAAQLPDSNPVKRTAVSYVDAYEKLYGKGTVSTFGAHVWDAGQLLVTAIPAALKVAQPGTPAFRSALRDALEGVKDMAGAHGIFDMSPGDHVGLDQRAAVMVKIENGAWKLIP